MTVVSPTMSKLSSGANLGALQKLTTKAGVITGQKSQRLSLPAEA